MRSLDGSADTDLKASPRETGGESDSPSPPASILPAKFRAHHFAPYRKPGDWERWAHLFEEQSSEPEGKLWEVCIIAAGRSLNGPRYTPETLQEAVPIFEGLPVYAFTFGDTDAKKRHLPDEAKVIDGRGLAGNRVGQIVKAWWNESEQEVDGLVAIDDRPTRERLLNAYKRGAICSGDASKDVEGLSIDAEGLKCGDEVTRIVRGGSLDQVTNPAAQGRYRRLVAATDTKLQQEPGGKNKMSEDAILTEDQTTLTEQSPVEQIKKLLLSIPEAQKAGVVQQLRGMLAQMMGADKYPLPKPAKAETDSEGDDKFAKLAAEILPMVEGFASHEDATVRRLIEKVTRKLKGESGDEDEKDQEIKRLRKQLKEDAIQRELDKHSDRFHDMDTVRALIDFDKVRVKEGKVSGLNEALDVLAKEKGFLVKPPPAPEPVQEEKEEETAETEKAEKPKPRGQNVRLTENVEGETAPTLTEQQMKSLAMRAGRGDIRALTMIERLEKQGVQFDL